MRELSGNSFGLLIAYLVPGFTVLLGVSFLSPTVALWLGATSADAPTLGGFLYVTVASVAAGLTVSTLRWLVIDTIHYATGVRRPEWDFSEFHTKVPGYDRLAEIHYDYYKFYGNTMVALAFAFFAVALAEPERIGLGLILAFVAIEGVFYFGSRDTLRKTYARVSILLGETRDATTRKPTNATRTP